MPFTAAFPFYAHDGLYHARERPIPDLSDSSSLAELLNAGLSANKETGAVPVSLYYTGISVQFRILVGISRHCGGTEDRHACAGLRGAVVFQIR